MKIKKGFNEGYIEGVYDERKRILEIIESEKKFIGEHWEAFNVISFLDFLDYIKQEIEKTEGKDDN